MTIANNANLPMARACFPTAQMGTQFFAPIAQFSCSAKYLYVKALQSLNRYDVMVSLANNLT